ncbi:MAG TPA: hypothetical protein VIM71_01630 [Lacunisphaera sp.]|jgi:hypothetical protein
MKSPHLAALTLLGIFTLGVPARAATLQTYFDFTTYGTVAGGSSITSSAYGVSSTSATVKSAATALTSTGLSITAGTDGGTTGVSMAASTLTGYTGDFSLQIWYTSPATIEANTALYGGTTTASADGNLTGDQALFTVYNGAKDRIRPIVGNNSKYGFDSNNNIPSGTGASLNTLYDYVVTYSMATSTFTVYMDGVQVGTTFSVPYFTGLNGLTSGFAIGGVENAAFGSDNTAGVNINSFMMYTGALDASTVSSLHSLGSNPNGSQFQSIGIAAVPEPQVIALILTAGLFGMVKVFARRRHLVA